MPFGDLTWLNSSRARTIRGIVRNTLPKSPTLLFFINIYRPPQVDVKTLFVWLFAHREFNLFANSQKHYRNVETKLCSHIVELIGNRANSSLHRNCVTRTISPGKIEQTHQASWKRNYEVCRGGKLRKNERSIRAFPRRGNAALTREFSINFLIFELVKGVFLSRFREIYILSSTGPGIFPRLKRIRVGIGFLGRRKQQRRITGPRGIKQKRSSKTNETDLLFEFFCLKLSPPRLKSRGE